MLGSACGLPLPSGCRGLIVVLLFSLRRWRVTEAALAGGCGDFKCLVCGGDPDLGGEDARICLTSSRQFAAWVWCGESSIGLVHSHIGGGGGASNIAVRVGVSVATFAACDSLAPASLSFDSACS